MLTYKATNTKTGRYYIGSAGSYCLYMNRIGNHHVRRDSSEFQKDLQNDPRSFIWEILKEDNLNERLYEYELLQQHVGDPLCYNKSKSNGGGFGGRAKGYTHTTDTKVKQSESQTENWKDNSQRRETVSTKMAETNSKLEPCPDCGKLMNAGNLSQHIRRQTCQRK